MSRSINRLFTSRAALAAVLFVVLGALALFGVGV